LERGLSGTASYCAIDAGIFVSVEVSLGDLRLVILDLTDCEGWDGEASKDLKLLCACCVGDRNASSWWSIALPLGCTCCSLLSSFEIILPSGSL
jgi:hypothetical protein